MYKECFEGLIWKTGNWLLPFEIPFRNTCFLTSHFSPCVCLHLHHLTSCWVSVFCSLRISEWMVLKHFTPFLYITWRPWLRRKTRKACHSAWCVPSYGGFSFFLQITKNQRYMLWVYTWYMWGTVISRLLLANRFFTRESECHRQEIWNLSLATLGIFPRFKDWFLNSYFKCIDC